MKVCYFGFWLFFSFSWYVVIISLIMAASLGFSSRVSKSRSSPSLKPE